MKALLNIATYKSKLHKRKVEIISFHCQFLCVGQGMRHIYLYLWYPLFQAMEYMSSTKSPNVELLNETTSSI